MLETTKKLIGKMNKLMDKVKEQVTFDDLMCMDHEQKEALSLSLELYSESCELMQKQAEIIDRLDKTTQELLETNKKLLEKAKDL